jgi:hypothetical protein
MKTLTLLAITGGLFFASPGLDSKHVKSNKECTKISAKHCTKKSCNSKKAKSAVISHN